MCLWFSNPCIFKTDFSSLPAQHYSCTSLDKKKMVEHFCCNYQFHEVKIHFKQNLVCYIFVVNLIYSDAGKDVLSGAQSLSCSSIFILTAELLYDWR